MRYLVQATQKRTPRPVRAKPDRLRQIFADLAILAVALARRPPAQERQVVERWLAARSNRD